MTYRVKQVVIATDAWLLFTFSDLRPEGEEQNSNTGQPHEDTPANKGGRKKKREKDGKKETEFMFLKMAVQQFTDTGHIIFSFPEFSTFLSFY